MNITKPKKLENEDIVRAIAPANSFSRYKPEVLEIGKKWFENKGIKLEFGKNAFKACGHAAGTIEERLEDFHSAFENKQVKAIIGIGGFNSHQLLEYIDWKTVKKNPKVFCGFSDITALNNAILAKAGLANFSGPSFSTFCQPKPFKFSEEFFEKIVMKGESNIELKPSDFWAEDQWRDKPLDAERELQKNPGWKVFKEGKAKGQVFGGNASTLVLLLGTEYFPKLKEKILFIEDDYEAKPWHFDRYMTQLRQAGVLEKIKGLVVGRFETASGFNENDSLEMILKDALKGIDIPVITGIDIGHTDPILTIPLGINCRIDTAKPEISFMESAVE